MDNLKSLMDKHEFELVIKLTENAKDSTSIFYRIGALLSTNKGQEALTTIKKNRKELEKDMAVLIKVHIETLCILGLFDEAHEELEYYKNLPYVSQEVEEILKDIPKYIRLEEKNMFKMPVNDDETLIKYLKGTDIDMAIAALDEIRSRDITKFIPAIAYLMVNFEKQSVRSFALLLLVQKQVDKTFKFNNMGKLIDVNPKDLEPPFVDEGFISLVKRLENEYKNPVVSDNAIQLYSSYIIYTYPNTPKFDEDKLVIALHYIANHYLQMDNSNLKIDKDMELLIASIMAVLEDF